MNPDAVLERILSKFPDAFIESEVAYGEASLMVEPSKWPSVSKWLAAEGGFAFLSSLSAVDWLERTPRFEVVYNLTDIDEPQRVCIRLPVADSETPKVPSVVSLWPTADFQEREAYDMFGIVFEGHPDLTRILMPDEWEGHPLRKDYAVGKVPIEYKHLSPGF